MSKLVQSLKSKQSELLAENEALLQLAEAEGRVLSEEEDKTWNDTLKEIDKISAQIKKHEDLINRKNLILSGVQIPPIVGDKPPITQGAIDLSGYSGSRLKCFLNNDGSPNLERAYKFGVFLGAMIYKIPKYRERLREWGYVPEKLAMGTSGASAIVPPEWATDIIKLRDEYGAFRRNARFRNMPSGTLNIPRHTGSVTAYWIDENTAITESEDTFGNTQLVAKKLAALTRYSNELDEDALIDIGDELAVDFAWAMARAEDLAGFYGDGTSTYGGVLGIATILNDGNHDASLYTGAAGEINIGALDVEDFIEVVARLPQQYHQFARWYTSSYTYAMGMLRLGQVGGGTTVVTIREGLQFSFLGYPVEITTVMPGAGMPVSSIPVLFGALRFSSTLGERRGLIVEKSDQRYFELDQIGIRATERIDIENHDLGTDTVAGPVIALKLAAA